MRHLGTLFTCTRDGWLSLSLAVIMKSVGCHFFNRGRRVVYWKGLTWRTKILTKLMNCEAWARLRSPWMVGRGKMAWKPANCGGQSKTWTSQPQSAIFCDRISNKTQLPTKYCGKTTTRLFNGLFCSQRIRALSCAITAAKPSSALFI